MATHSSTLAWQISWMEEESGRLQSMRSQRVGHDWATSLSLFTFMHWRRKWQPTPVFLPGESQGQWSLVDCCLWGRTELDTTEWLNWTVLNCGVDFKRSKSMEVIFILCNWIGGFPGASVVKNLPTNTTDSGDMSLIPGSRRFPRVGNGILIQYSCLENSMDRGALQATLHGVSKSQIRLSICIGKMLHSMMLHPRIHSMGSQRDTTEHLHRQAEIPY